MALLGTGVDRTLLDDAAAPCVSFTEQMMLQLPADGSHTRDALTDAFPSATAIALPAASYRAHKGSGSDACTGCRLRASDGNQ